MSESNKLWRVYVVTRPNGSAEVHISRQKSLNIYRTDHKRAMQVTAAANKKIWRRQWHRDEKGYHEFVFVR